MKRIISVLVLSAVCLSFFSWECNSQDRKIVTGRIINKTTGKPFGRNDISIEIYGFDTEAVAEDVFRELSESPAAVINNAYFITPPDESGYFTATLPPTGSMIVKPGISKPILLHIRHRTDISLSIDVGELIEASTKVEPFSHIGSLEEEVEISGNNLNALYTFKVPRNIGADNARLILQPVFMEARSGDTLSFLKPWVFDGKQYALAQERKMAYNIENDPLYEYVREEELTSDEFIVQWKDTVYLEDPKGHYYIKGKLILEDYNMIYYIKDSLPLASSRARRRMQFLDYSLETPHLDPQEYLVRPRPEKIESHGEMSLTFLVNKAALDHSDPQNKLSLDKLKSDLLTIVRSETSRLTEFHIVGVASPDGRYSKNLALANERTKYAFNEVTSVLPKHDRDRIYMTNKSIVAPWSDVADLLEKEGRTAEAADVRRILAAEGNHDRQGDRIRRLPYYKTTISPLLPRLRTVKYTYAFDEIRELRPDEILTRYRTDEEYISGKKHFALYEYWHLFQMVEDPEELKALYRRAYEETKETNSEPWIYASNLLARTLRDADIADTTILSHFIDDRFKCNATRTNLDGTKEKVNPAPVVANQLCMFLMSNNFKRASVMSQMLPNTDEYKLLKAVTMCLGGYYKGGRNEKERAERAEWYEIVKESSPRNRVVMLLALDTRSHTLLAEKAVEQLPADDPLTWYFKAIISGRKCNFPDADFMEPENFYMYLQTCFDMDRSFIGLARNDGDIDEDELNMFFKYNPQYDTF